MYLVIKFCFGLSSSFFLLFVHMYVVGQNEIQVKMILT